VRGEVGEGRWRERGRERGSLTAAVVASGGRGGEAGGRPGRRWTMGKMDRHARRLPLAGVERAHARVLPSSPLAGAVLPSPRTRRR
jgi:hypothetical protein